MVSLGPLDAARLSSLASGRGSAPGVDEWPWLFALLALFAFVGTRFLLSVGMRGVDAALLAVAAPLLVFVDAPLGPLTPEVQLAANATGCAIPILVGLRVLLWERLPWTEMVLLLGVAIVVSHASSHVVPREGVLLQYRIPAFVVGALAAGLFHHAPGRAGLAGFSAGALGVLVGADLLRLHELAALGGTGRVILGGAALLDGILLVAVLGAAVGECAAVLLRARARARVRHPSRPAV